jgi:DNA-binding transcriptional LysR family regulator
MSLSSLNLDAFAAVAKHKSFSQAANRLNVTQSALSQRVLNLESDLGSTLFIRDPAGIRLTDLGQKLLRYCQSKTMLEDEFMESLKAHDGKSLSGIVRVGGFSTFNRPILLPTIGEFLKKNPLVNVEIQTDELRYLPAMLYSGTCDLVVVNQPIDKQGVENLLLGHEEYVLVQSPLKSTRQDVYLVHDEEDTTTADFLKLQAKKTPKLKRNFLGEIYSIIDAVKLGMGRAVVPMHMVEDLRGVEVVKGYSSLKVPVHLSYFNQAFFTELQKIVIKTIQEGAAKYLK